jgi:hypothetical protein
MLLLSNDQNMTRIEQICALIIFAVTAGTSRAHTIDYFDSPVSNYVIEGHSIHRTLNYDASLWNPGGVNFATLTLFLGDDSHHDPREYARLITIFDNGTSLGPSEIVEVDGTRFAPLGYFDFEVAPILNAADAEGNLTFKLFSPHNGFGLGDFFYKGAQLHIDFNPVPLPASIAFLLPAVAVFGLIRRRKNR